MNEGEAEGGEAEDVYTKEKMCFATFGVSWS